MVILARSWFSERVGLDREKGRGEFRTISLPALLVERVETLIEELKFWPTKTDFVREAVIEKLERYREELEAKKK
jgi:Arc/MetJ-type ribon-helix-helix transcriptional regulator